MVVSCQLSAHAWCQQRIVAQQHVVAQHRAWVYGIVDHPSLAGKGLSDQQRCSRVFTHVLVNHRWPGLWVHAHTRCIDVVRISVSTRFPNATEHVQEADRCALDHATPPLRHHTTPPLPLPQQPLPHHHHHHHHTTALRRRYFTHKRLLDLLRPRQMVCNRRALCAPCLLYQQPEKGRWYKRCTR